MAKKKGLLDKLISKATKGARKEIKKVISQPGRRGPTGRKIKGYKY